MSAFNEWWEAEGATGLNTEAERNLAERAWNAALGTGKLLDALRGLGRGGARPGLIDARTGAQPVEPEVHYCASPSCPGRPYKASAHRHPPPCVP